MALLPQLERELLAAHERRQRAPRRARARAWLTAGAAHAVPVLAVAVAAAVVAVVLVVSGSRRTPTGPPGGSGPNQLVFQAYPTTPGASGDAATAWAAVLLRRRLHAVLGAAASVTRAGRSGIIVHAPAADRQAVLELAQPGRIAFYDWEADALTPNGRTVAAQLPRHNPTAMEISQGGSQGPGAPGAATMALYPAVQLAAHRPAAPTSSGLARRGPEYYLFGAPGSAACAAAANAQGTASLRRQHCLLAGRAPTIQILDASVPPGVDPAAGQVLRVPQGTVLLSAGGLSSAEYVLRDEAALTNHDVTNPRPAAGPSGSPALRLSLTPAGAAAFRRLTAAIARRGAQDSTAGEALYQHIAIAVDGRLLTVPYINFRQFPEGVQSTKDVDVIGNLSRQATHELSVLLRYGPLPVDLVPR